MKKTKTNKFWLFVPRIYPLEHEFNQVLQLTSAGTSQSQMQHNNPIAYIPHKQIQLICGVCGDVICEGFFVTLTLDLFFVTFLLE